MDNKRLLISLYDGCQYHCTFCMYGYVKETQPLSQKDSMSAQQWYDVLATAYLRGFRELEIGGRGEPTLNPVFTKVVTIAHELGYSVELLSNTLNDKVIVEVLPMIRTLTINVNALNEHEMAKIHQPSPGFSFDRCMGSIKNVLRSIGERNLNIELRINYVLTTQSLREAFLFPKRVNQLFAAELGFRRLYIAYRHVHNYIKTPANLGFDYEGIKKILLLARLNSRDEFLLKHSDLREFIAKTEKLIERLKPISEKSHDAGSSCARHVEYTCEVHKYLLFIDGNGDCYGCFNAFRAANGLPIDKDPFYFGNLFSKDFDEIFYERKGFNPIFDVSRKYWGPCLLCKAVEASVGQNSKGEVH